MKSISERLNEATGLFGKLCCMAIISFVIVFTTTAQENKSFLQPPRLIKNQVTMEERYKNENREFSGISSIAITPKGRIWAVWYAGITPDEDVNNYVVLATSDDKGNSWKETVIIDPDQEGPVRAFDPELWIDPTGKLWVFWAQSIDHDGTVAGVWAITTNYPEVENPDWTATRRLTNGIMMCKPLVLSTGEWILPASTWRLTDNSAKIIVSLDNGNIWTEKGAVNISKDVRSFDEHMIVEKKNGDIWMLVRTKYGIGESVSSDGGYTWSPLVPSKIQHPAARFFIRRLNSGNLLLVKHGPINMKTGRSHLMAFVSKDDGYSWSHGLLLDERPGVSYPDGQQTIDGMIYITYDFNRTKEQMILMTSFTEEDIFDNDYDSKIIEVYNRRKVVSMGR
jgi:predicted neuraminidase